MPSVSVRVFNGKRLIKTIERPLHDAGDSSHVTYKGKHYRLLPGNCIQLQPDTEMLHLTSSITEQTFEKAEFRLSDGEMKYPTWDPEQICIIEADADERLLVDAGPGTGKTAVACARVAWLIDQAGIEPSEIWLVSFTRTAVHELRNRIGTYLADSSLAAGIRIATIDSHSWSIQSGFNTEATMSGYHEDNIRKTIELIEKHEGVFEYLSEVRHLFIDEAQDVIGVRVQLLLEMIHALPPESGVTVLSDEAQAIYGFAEDEDETGIRGTLPDAIREYMADEFTEKSLVNIHRTADETLRKLLTDGRKLLRKKRGSGEIKLEAVRTLIQETNHGRTGIYRDDLAKLPSSSDNVFLLFRRRGEVLQASSYLALRPHRVRMSGLPPMIHEWVALVFWDWTDPDMNEAIFAARYRERGGEIHGTVEEAWKALVRVAGISPTRISNVRLAQRLAGGAPPTELCVPDFGTEGPLVGTIHGAKGREADYVRLYVPGPGKKSQSRDVKKAFEEARILFVGASRARKQLVVGKGATRSMPRRVAASGRAYTPTPFAKDGQYARSMVEIGHAGDLECSGLVGTDFYVTSEQALAAQKKVAAHSGKMACLKAVMTGNAQSGRYTLVGEAEDTSPWAFLSSKVDSDLRSIAKAVDEIVHLGRLKLPDQILHLKSFGVRTVVVAPDDPIREKLHTPWRDSGFMLAPLVLGYGLVYFRY